MDQPPRSPSEDQDDNLPVEVELYIEPDGSVTFADLAADTLPIVKALNPDQPLACDVPHEAADGDPSKGSDHRDA
jgi:hypothetical protein